MSAMSCADSKKFSEPQIIKFDGSEDKVTVSGKPCIDFQPDDRWQIKDEESSGEAVANSAELKNGSHSQKVKNSKSNDSTTVINGEAVESNACNKVNSEEPTGTSDITENHSKRKRTASESDSMPDCDIKKKIKVDNAAESNTEKSKSATKENADDSNDKMTMPNLSPATSEYNAKPAENTKENSDTQTQAMECDGDKSQNEEKEEKPMEVDGENIPTLEKIKKTDASISQSDNKCDDVQISQSNSNKSDDAQISQSDSNKSDDAQISQSDSNKSDDAQISQSDGNKSDAKTSQSDNKKSNDVHTSQSDKSKSNVNGKDVEIEVININDDKKSDSESDSEVQIINPDDMVKKISSELVSTPTSDLPYTLTAGFPYYNSLKEKIKNFKAGEYKPVKFPHTGTLLLAENEVIIESPSLLVPLLIKEPDEIPKLDSDDKKTNGEDAATSRPNISKRNFFQSSVGQFLINLGLSRVQEWYHKDMKRTKSKQFRSTGSTDKELEKTCKEHEKKHEELKLINAAFNFRMHHCKFCDFRSESLTVMEGHYLIPHVTNRREYKCNFCTCITRDPEVIVQHYDKVHGKKAILDSYIPFHECIFCSFQSHLKNKVNAHMNRCRKHFIPSQNLSPPYDFEFPGVTTKPVTINDVIGHRRLLLSSAKNPRMPVGDDNSSTIYARKKLASVLTKLSGQNSYNDLKNPSLMKQLMTPQSRMSTVSGSNLQLPPGLVITRPRGQMPPVQASVNRFQGPRAMPAIRGVPPRRGPPYTTNLTNAASQLASSGISITPVTRGNTGPARTNVLPGTKNVTLTPIGTATNRTVSQKPGPPQPVALFTNMAGSNNMMGQPQARLPANMHLRPLRPAPPYQRLNTPPSQVVKGASGNTFVVCEICDSYIKDLEELRTHMNWVHKVKIHPKMLVSRPPLNCQKCHWRFFTDQGLERHLLGAHGLVTTNMQEMANKNQDGGRCIICGAVFTYKLVSHMTQVHKVTLKPAHLSYKCTVCTATFTLYRLFESHVYNVHSGSAKRSAEDTSSSSESAPKKKAAVETGPRRCKDCGYVTENMHDHLVKAHLKNCAVKLCKIEKCEKCLYSSDEMLVITMADFGLGDELDDSGEDSSDEDSSEENEEAEDKDSAANSKEDDSSKTGDQDEIHNTSEEEKVGSKEPS